MHWWGHRQSACSWRAESRFDALGRVWKIRVWQRRVLRACRSVRGSMWVDLTCSDLGGAWERVWWLSAVFWTSLSLEFHEEHNGVFKFQIQVDFSSIENRVGDEKLKESEVERWKSKNISRKPWLWYHVRVMKTYMLRVEREREKWLLLLKKICYKGR